MKKNLKQLVLNSLLEVKKRIISPFIFIKSWLIKKWYRILVTFKYQYSQYFRILIKKYYQFKYFIISFEFKKKIKTQLIPLLFNIITVGYLIYYVYPIANPLQIGIGIALIQYYFKWFLKTIKEHK